MKYFKLIIAAAGLVLALCLITSCGKFLGGDVATVTDTAPSSTTVPTKTTPTTIETTTAPKPIVKDKLIAFTFDDGPRVKTTGKILDLLEKNDARATFFVIGQNVSDKGTVLRRAIMLGCEIGNHSMNHKNFLRLSDKKIKEQLDLSSDAVEAATGILPTLVRVPGGNYKGIEKKVGYPLIQWSIDTNDWRYSDVSKPERSSAQRKADINKVAASILDCVKPGDIILMHDIYDFSVEVFEKVLPELIKRGYKLVTVSEMYDAYGIKLEAGKVYHCIRTD